jgi:uncharacterized peroxidase-related enzyme
VKDDFTKAPLTPRERRIADFAVKVTRAPNTCSPEDVQGLREAGLSDEEVLGLAEVVAYYNLSTRLFESLSTVDP